VAALLGGGGMNEYQLYFLNAAGVLVRREEFKFQNDAEALAHAKHFVDGLALELWSGTRIVGRINPRHWASKTATPKIPEVAIGNDRSV
jgi:hypothetical protein